MFLRPLYHRALSDTDKRQTLFLLLGLSILPDMITVVGSDKIKSAIDPWEARIRC